MNTIRLLIIDDSEIHLIGLKSILSAYPDMLIVGEAHTKSEAFEILKKVQTDILLLDISLETEMDGFEVARFVDKHYPEIRVIILSHYKKIEYIITALREHVRAYLAKDTKTDELLQAIRSVYTGCGVFFGDSIAYRSLLEAFGNEKNLAYGKPYELTEREIQVIELLAQGYSSKEIGRILQIDRNTVESHKERIKNKLALNNMIEIVVFALKKKIITGDWYDRPLKP